MKKLYLLFCVGMGSLFLLPGVVWSQRSCPNLDFSYGNFTYWQPYTGRYPVGVITDFKPDTVTPGRHEIMVASRLIAHDSFYDEKCNAIQKVPDGFYYSAKLGDALNPNATMEALEYTLTVDSNSSLLILHFAWIMYDFGHPPETQPQFTMALKDSAGNLMNLPCANVNFVCSQDLQDLICPPSGIHQMMGRDWTTAGFNLEPFIGRTIKIYYETRDCGYNTDYGYAYIVAECRPMRIQLEFCAGQVVARMEAPDGFVSYKWTRTSQPWWSIQGDNKTAKRISVQDAVEGETFTCELTSELGSECNAVVKVEIKRTIIDADFGYGIKDVNGNVPLFGYPHDGDNWYDTCTRTTTFVDLSHVMNNTKDNILWEIFDPKDPTGKGILASSADSLFTYTFPDPDSTPVTYRVRLTCVAENGCMDTSKNRPEQRITIYPSPRIKIVGEDQICEGDSIGLKATTVRSVFVEHQWNWIDSTGTYASNDDSITIYRPAIFVLISKDSAGCYATDTLNVTPLRPVLRPDVTDVSCYGSATAGFTHGQITGGLPPFPTFYWIFPCEDGRDTIIVPNTYLYGVYQNLKAGIYRFVARDSRDCPLAGEFEIKQSDSLQIMGVSYPTTCGLDNGRLRLTAIGGRPPYKFEVKDTGGAVMTLIKSSSSVPYPDSAAGLRSEKYIITVTDAVDNVAVYDKDSILRIPKKDTCTTSDIIEITAAPMPSMEIDSSSIAWETCDGANGSVSIRAVNAQRPIEYTWTLDTGKMKTENSTLAHLKGGEYTVSLKDGNGCITDTTITIGYYPPIRADVQKTPETCGRKDGTITLTVNERPHIPTRDSNIVVYKWEGRNDTTASLTGLKAGTYKVSISDAFCFWDTAITVNAVNGPIANFVSSSQNVASNTVFVLTDISQGTVRKWNWDMDDGTTQTGKMVYYSYPVSGDYRVFLEVTDENICIDTISKTVHIYEELNVFIPNMFTPNGDGINDVWKPIMSEYVKEGYKLSVFDRWGQVIFQTTDTDKGWDGTVNGNLSAPNAVYSYRIIVRDFTGYDHEFIGHITVVK